MDYKILTKLFASRLQDILPDLIGPDQRGFVKDRRLSNGILDLYAIIDLVIHKEDDFLLCTIDIQKAFDSINWKFLKYVFNLFGFPDVFTSWFNVFYTDRITYIENNHSRSPPIKIERGNFQGCPLSPLLFILVIEILAIRIRNNPEIVGIDCNNIVKKLNLVADNLLLVFKNSFLGCEQLEQELKEFSLNSGLNVNKEKCTVTHLSPSLLPPDPNVLPLFKRNQDQFSYVGFNFPLQQEKLWDVNVPDKIATLLFNASRACNSVDTPPLGKVTAFKSLFFSTLPYFMEKLPLPGAPEISKFQSDLDKIVWNGKKPKMKICISVFPPLKGGLGMIDVAKCLQAQKLQVVQLALNMTHMEFWQSHLISLFRVPFDLAIRANLTYKVFLKLFIRPPPLFWQDAFKMWCSFLFCNYSYSNYFEINDLFPNI